MERQRKALVVAVPAAAAALTVLGALAEAKKLPDDLERSVQVPCRDGMADGSQEPPDDGGAPRVKLGSAAPAKAVVRALPAMGTATPAETA